MSLCNDNNILKYRAFHNVLPDYKHLQQENQRTYLSGIVHSHGKTGKVFFLQLEVTDECNVGDTAHIDTIFKFFNTGAAILSLRTLISPNGRNVNHDEKRLCENFSDVPSICKSFTNPCPTVFLSNFCNPGILTTRDVRCVHRGRHGSHRYDIQVLVTRAPTWEQPFSRYIRLRRLTAEM
jgi:hypothetical protein